MHRRPEHNPETIFAALSAISVGQRANVQPPAVRQGLESLYLHPDERLDDVNDFTDDVRLIGGAHLECLPA